MVLKLIKHEIKYLGRYLGLIWMGIILMIVSQRFLTELSNSDNEVLQLIGSGAIMLMIFSFVAMFLITFIAIVMRFYQNMFSGEGYLTFTLPVKTGSILFSKLLVGWMFMLVPMIILILTMVSYIREPNIWYLMYSGLLGFLDQTEYSVYALVVLGISLLLAPIAQLLEFYLAMSLGQLANRNKIVFSIIAYIGLYMIKQVFGVVFWIIMVLGRYYEKFEYYPMEFFETTTWISFISLILMIIIDWILVHYLCKNKLNLE